MYLMHDYKGFIIMSVNKTYLSVNENKFWQCFSIHNCVQLHFLLSVNAKISRCYYGTCLCNRSRCYCSRRPSRSLWPNFQSLLLVTRCKPICLFFVLSHFSDGSLEIARSKLIYYSIYRLVCNAWRQTATIELWVIATFHNDRCIRFRQEYYISFFTMITKY